METYSWSQRIPPLYFLLYYIIFFIYIQIPKISLTTSSTPSPATAPKTLLRSGKCTSRRRVIIHTLLSRMSSYPQGQRLGY